MLRKCAPRIRVALQPYVFHNTSFRGLVLTSKSILLLLTRPIDPRLHGRVVGWRRFPHCVWFLESCRRVMLHERPRSD